MKTHNFTLMLKVLEMSDELFEALEDAGCDDATLYQIDNGVFLEFDRMGKSYEAALFSALRDVQEKADVQVRKIVTDDLVNASQIAERLKRTRQSIHLLIKGDRGPGGFPTPVHTVGKRPLWGWGDVIGWFERNKIETPETVRTSAFVGAMNDALSLIEHEVALSEAEVRRVHKLLEQSRKRLEQARKETAKAMKEAEQARKEAAKAMKKAERPKVGRPKLSAKKRKKAAKTTRRKPAAKRK